MENNESSKAGEKRGESQCYSLMRYFFLTFLLLGIVGTTSMPFWTYAQTHENPVSPGLHVPENFEEAQKGTEEAGKRIWEELPRILKDIWNNEILPLWKTMWNWVVMLWDHTVKAWVEACWEWLRSLFGEEIDTRTESAREQIEKEKQELQEELEKEGENITRSLWQRFKDLFRNADTP